MGKRNKSRNEDLQTDNKKFTSAEDNVSQSTVHDVIHPLKRKKNKKMKVENNDSEKSKKTIFVDNEPQEVPATSGCTINDTVKNESKKFLNDDEAEVKDEDIDKFCDELDEEDNAQFEDWVKQIEANFHSNKKKA